MLLKGEITDEQKLAIDELRKRVTSEVEQDLHEDVHLFRRFLAGRDFNIDSAESMLRKHLEWRKKYDLKNILDFKKPEVVEKYVVYDLLGHDKEGNPVRFFPIGNTDVYGVLESVKFEDIVKSAIYELESDTRIHKEQSKKLGKNVDQTICIVDFKNVSFAQLTAKRTISTFIFLSHLYINNYPERLKGVYILNVPIYFNMLYATMSAILPSNVLNKIRVYSDESYKKDILEKVDADELPAFLGGNQTDPDGNPLCITKLKQVEGRVPQKCYIQRNKRCLSKLPGVRKVTLSRAAFHEVKLEVKEPGSYLEWEFETKCRDIGFGLFRNEVADGGEEQITELVPIQRIDTEENPETGTLKCENPGAYVIVFDNTYSWIRAKEIYYRVRIVPPEEYDAEIEKE